MTIEGLGKKFQEARLARGLTLDEAARMTKIRPSRLAEIEADDFSQFPSLAYAKGFLLIYGKFLDVDVTPYMEAFETSGAGVTVDGYSYLQDNPTPAPVRAPIVRRRPARVRAPSPSSGERTSLMPLIFGVVVIVVGFLAMKLVLNLQRLGAPHEEQPATAQVSPSVQPSASTAPAAAPQLSASPPAQAAASVAASVAPSIAPPVVQSPSVAPSASVVAAAVSPPAASPKPSAVAAVSPLAASPKPSVMAAVSPPAASPKATVMAAASPVPKPSSTVFVKGPEPEVRRAEPVRPEDLANAGAAAATATPAAAAATPAPTASPAAAAATSSGPNTVAIRPVKKTYVRVIVDNESTTPVYERWLTPSDEAVEFRGQKINIKVLDRDAVQIKKNGKLLAAGDEDVTIE